METITMSNEGAENLAISMYLGESCKYCGFTANTIKDLHDKDVVYVGYHNKGRWACRSCFNKHGDSDLDNPKNKETSN